MFLIRQLLALEGIREESLLLIHATGAVLVISMLIYLVFDNRESVARFICHSASERTAGAGLLRFQLAAFWHLLALPYLLLNGVRGAAYRIIEGKGATYFGIAAGLAHIVQAIRDDERRILTVPGLTGQVTEFKGTCLSLPRLIGASGIMAGFRPELSDAEDKDLRKSAAILRNAVERVKLEGL